MKAHFLKTQISISISLFLLNTSIAQDYNAGGKAPFLEQHTPCLSEAQRQEIQLEIAKALHQSKSESNKTQSTTAFENFVFPLRKTNTYQGRSFYGISNYVDHLPAFQALQDYNCGTRTYDLSNYNHAGTDFFLWPEPWNMMAANQVEVIAAAKGKIVYKQDGNFDRSCGFNSNQWNAIYLDHGNGIVAWYGHMKSNSLTSKNVGDSVLAGEYLGVVGSSGSSSGPHLHFEVYKNNTLVDPWEGSCNPGQSSLWQNQPSYYDPMLIRTAIASGQPQYPNCPSGENLKAVSILPSGAMVYLTNYYRDMRQGDTTYIKILNASGNTINQFFTVHNVPGGHYAAAWWYWSFNNFSNGRYRFLSTYKKRTDTAFVDYGIVSNKPLSPKIELQLFKNEAGIWEIGPIDHAFEIMIMDLLGRKICNQKLAISNSNTILDLPRAKGHYIVQAVESGLIKWVFIE